MVGGWIISVYIFFLLLICVFRFFLQSTCVIHIVGVKGRCAWGAGNLPFLPNHSAYLLRVSEELGGHRDRCWSGQNSPSLCLHRAGVFAEGF